MPLCRSPHATPGPRRAGECVGVVGGANDFGQDPVMIQESNKRHFFPKKFSGLNELDPSSPDFNPLSEQYQL